MSRLGNIYNSYGKQFSIAIANTYSDNVLNSVNLPKNTVIISSPYDINSYEDLGTSALLVTDSYGEPILLTKTILQKNGIRYSNDSLYLSIDNNTIKTDTNGKLYVDFSSFVNTANGLNIDNSGKISIENSNLQKASSGKFGVAKVDGMTLNSDNGRIYVETSKLDYATNDLYGIVKGDNVTIKTINGVPNIITENLNKASSSYGICKVDGESIISNNGVLSLNENFFMSNDNSGLLMVDGTSVISNNGVLSATVQNLNKSSETEYGTIKIDSSEFDVDNNGVLSVKNYNNVSESLQSIKMRIDSAHNEISMIENEIANL